MTNQEFFERFGLFSDLPDAVAEMRQLILALAIQGKLISRDANQESAEASLPRLAAVALPLSGRDSYPDHWLQIELGDSGTWYGGGTPSKARPEFWIGDVPWVSPKDMKVLLIDDAQDHVSEAAIQGSAARIIPPGSLLMVVRGMILAKAFPVAQTTRSVTINQDMKALLVSEPEAAPFILLALRALEGKVLACVERSSHGTCKLRTELLERLIVPVPPLAEQKQIVAKVDELMALCDRLEAQQKERETRHAALARASLSRFADAPTPANLTFLFHKSYAIPPADLRKSILTLAVQGKLVPQRRDDGSAAGLLADISRSRGSDAKGGLSKGFKGIRSIVHEELPYDVPSNWEWVRTETICEAIVDCPHSTPHFVPAGVACLDTNGFKEGRLIPNRIRFVSEEAYAARVRRLEPQGGDIVFAREGSVGASVIIPENMRCCLGQRVMLFRLMPGILPEFFAKTISEASSLERLLAFHKGIGAKHVNVGDMRNALLPLPPLAEQRRIVARVDQLMALVDELETQLAASRVTAAKLLDAIVGELTGSHKH